MRYLAIASLLFLSACANDRYAVVSGGPGTETNLSADLHSCKLETIDHDTSEHHTSAVFTGALIGGFVGAAAVGIAEQSKNDPDAEIEACMRARGYEGTSEN